MAAAAATLKERWTEVPDGMKGPLIVSGIIHVVLVILAITGLPYFKQDPEPLMSAIPIEILPIAETRQTNKTPLEAPPRPEEEIQTKPKDAKPLPPKVEEVKTPEPPKPPKAEKPKPKVKPVTPPPPDEAALEKVKEKPEEKKPPEPVEAKEKAEEQNQDFSKLLKNLQDAPQPTDETLPESKEATPPAPAPVAQQAAEMTMNEYDALSQQLQNCWSIQAGARYAEDLVVKVRLTVSPDRHVMSATVVDTWRYSQDSYFRAAADAAIRAVNSPQCETLVLPPDKYEVWKDMVVTFDPRDML